MRHALLFILFAALTLSAAAQDNPATKKNKIITEAAGRPDIPGDLMIDLGFTTLSNNPEEMKLNFWGSRIFNVYYLFSKPIAESGLSLHPGLGIGTAKYAFNDKITIGYEDVDGVPTMSVIPLTEAFPQAERLGQTQLASATLDAMAELRWNSRKYDHKRSFKVVIGGKLGYMIDSKTKVRYFERGEWKIAKQKESFQLNFLRYSAYGRIGYGNVYLHYTYTFAPLFQPDEGPLQSEATPMSFGLSIGLF